MVSRLLRALSIVAKSKSARTNHRHQARSSRRQLEIALQQSANNCPKLERSGFFLQRSRFPDRLRMRLKKSPTLDCSVSSRANVRDLPKGRRSPNLAQTCNTLDVRSTSKSRVTSAMLRDSSRCSE